MSAKRKPSAGAAPEGTTADAAAPAVPPSDSGEITQDDIDALVTTASAAPPPDSPSASPAATRGASANIDKYEFAELAAPASSVVDPKRLSMLNDVKLRVKVELGRTRMLVEDVLGLGEGSVVELDKLAGDPVDVYANDRLVARGEVLVLNDSFCVRISEVISSDPHRVST